MAKLGLVGPSHAQAATGMMHTVRAFAHPIFAAVLLCFMS
jgi:hypothetical protein